MLPGMRHAFQQQQRQQQGGTEVIKCRIWWDDNASAYVISTAYSKDLVGALKQFIPSGDRQYDDQSKHWYVKESYGEFIRTMAEKAFGVGSVSFTSRTVSQQAQSGPRAYGSGAQGAYLNPTTGGTTEDAIVAFFGLLSYDAAKKAYLVGAQSMHPDKGGDPAKMAKLNELWTRIEKEFFKR